MELEGVVHNGIIVPDDATVLPEGTRVRISAALRDDLPGRLAGEAVLAHRARTAVARESIALEPAR